MDESEYSRGVRDPGARRLSVLVDHYLREWDSREWAAAYHALIQLGPDVVPLLQERMAETAEGALRAALVEVARQTGAAQAVPLFAAALHDPEPAVWKEGLDGLVSLSSPEAVAVLTEALAQDPPGRTAPEDWRGWLEEALDQARGRLAERGGAA
jgi:HEAT repeat protein